MNYINNPTAIYCCGFGRDKIEVSETYAMIDCDTGEEVKGFMFVPGHAYHCAQRWALTQSYMTLGTFLTREQAVAAYKKIVDDLRKDNVVIDI